MVPHGRTFPGKLHSPHSLTNEIQHTDEYQFYIISILLMRNLAYRGCAACLGLYSEEAIKVVIEPVIDGLSPELALCSTRSGLAHRITSDHSSLCTFRGCPRYQELTLHFCWSHRASRSNCASPPCLEQLVFPRVHVHCPHQSEITY